MAETKEFGKGAATESSFSLSRSPVAIFARASIETACRQPHRPIKVTVDS
jgi:hypothetical protein